MSAEQAPIVPAEHMYEVHKTDVKAVRELGGLAFAGAPEPGAKLSERSDYLLNQSNGDAKAAADLAKQEASRINDQLAEIVSENLDHYAQQAREDMENDKVDQIYQQSSKLISRDSIYRSRRERGIGYGDDEPSHSRKPLKQMEAAIDPLTGQAVLPLEHYARSRH